MSSGQGIPLTPDRGGQVKRALFGLVWLIVAGVLGYLATIYGFMAGLGSFIFGLAGISLIAMSFTFMGKGPCPACNTEMRGISKNEEAAHCGNCGDYSVAREGQLFRTPENHVTAESSYPIELEAEKDPGFPAACVTCGAPAVTAHPRELEKTIVGVPGVGKVLKKWTVALPLCERHQTPDSLGNPPGVTSFENVVKISSYRVWREMRGRGARPA